MLITAKNGKIGPEKEFSKIFKKLNELFKAKDGFLGYDADAKIENKVVVVPFGLEKSVSYGGGTKTGLKKLLKPPIC